MFDAAHIHYFTFVVRLDPCGSCTGNQSARLTIYSMLCVENITGSKVLQ